MICLFPLDKHTNLYIHDIIRIGTKSKRESSISIMLCSNVIVLCVGEKPIHEEGKIEIKVFHNNTGTLNIHFDIVELTTHCTL